MAGLVMGVKIVRNDIKDRLDKLSKETSKNEIPDKVKELIMIQWLRNNLVRFNEQQYATKSGNLANWDKFKDNTKFYIIKRGGRYKKKDGTYTIREAGEKVWRNRKTSDGRKMVYSEESVLLQASAMLKKSSSVLSQVEPARKKGAYFVQIGSTLKQASKLHKQRPIVSISNKDKDQFKRIVIKWLKGEMK
jgi:hypothetical protein